MKCGLKGSIGKVAIRRILTGAGCAKKEGMVGGFVGAGLELASGIAATVGAVSAGGGTAVSYGLDAVILAR